MSVSLPILTRAIWIPDPCFSYPIASGKYWVPGSGIDDYIAPLADIDGLGTGRYTKINLEPAGTAFSADWIIGSAYSPYGVAAGPQSAQTLALYVYFCAKFSGAWSTGTQIVRAYVYSYDASGTLQQTSTAITFSDCDGTAMAVGTHTDWTLFLGKGTIAADNDARSYRLVLEYKDGTGTGPRYIEQRFCGLAIPFTESAITNDNLENWYDDAPQISARRQSAAGRGIHQQVLTLSFSAMSLNDLTLVRRAYQWNTGMPTDDVVTGVVNRGQASPLIFAINRTDVKRVFYADIGMPVIGNATGGGTYWPESGGVYACQLTLTERVE